MRQNVNEGRPTVLFVFKTQPDLRLVADCLNASSEISLVKHGILNMKIIWFRTLMLVLSISAFTAHAKVSPNIVNALKDAGRPQTDTELDADRKPEKMVEFAGLKPGVKVMDLFPGGGYFTRIFARVVGDKGHVYAYSPTEYDPIAKKRRPEFDATKLFLDYANVTVLHAPINSLSSPELLDVVWTAQNYHDFHNPFLKPADTKIINKAVFEALKPGGFYVVVDHSAKKGSGLSATETLHRIDEDTLKKEILAAGFNFVSQSSVLRNSKDSREKNVFDPLIRHKTDQFVLKFQKPLPKK